MRTIITLTLCFLSSFALYADEPDRLCRSLQLTDCITHLQIDLDTTEYQRSPIAFSRKAIDTRAIKSQRWFKPMVITYWVAAAVNSYRDDDEFELRANLLRERTVSTSFLTPRDSRIVFVPRSTPLIFFPLGRQKTAHLWAVHVTSHGGAITFAINLNGATRRKS